MTLPPFQLTKRQVWMVWTFVGILLLYALFVFDRTDASVDDLCEEGMKGTLSPGTIRGGYRLKCNPDRSAASEADRDSEGSYGEPEE